MTETTLEAAAERLRSAYKGGGVAPLRDVMDGTDGDRAYAIQEINTAYWRARGRRVVGRKVGLTAKAVQAQLGVGQPDFGVLFDDMQIADGGSVPHDKLLQPKAEAEIALLMKHDVVDPLIEAEELLAAIEAVVPAIEIVDSRITDWKITFADTVADNGSSAYFVLGSERRDPRSIDLYSCGMVLEINGLPVSLGAGAACLGHPLNAAVWLARTLADRGDPLRAGDIVLTGALGPMVPIKGGDRVRAQIGGVGTCGFVVSREAR